YRVEPAEGDQRVAAQGRILGAIDVDRLGELPEHLGADGQAAMSAEARPDRRLSPVVLGKEAEKKVALERRRQEAVLRIVEPAERRVGLAPEPRLAVGAAN